jgi:hypothetical protein
VAEAFGEFVIEQSYQYAARGTAAYPLVAPEGGKEPLNARLADFSTGSDHQIYTDSSFGIPAIYLNDWPDRYIHTNYDTPAMIDPTKLKRAAFIGAASGYFLSALTQGDAEKVWRFTESRSTHRGIRLFANEAETPSERDNKLRFQYWSELMLFNSMGRFFEIPGSIRDQQRMTGRPAPATVATGDGRLVFRRNPEIKGTMGAFGYDYFTDKYGEEKAATIRLLRHSGLRGSGSEYAYEVLNLVDGKRNVQDIRDAVSAIYGPIGIDLVMEYLRALETIQVVRKSGIDSRFD